jgi:hypothetical protein
MPPVTPTIDSFPPDPGVDLSARFEFSSTDSGVTFLARLDSDSFVPAVSPLFYSGPLSAGNHTFQVKATDGMAESSVASYGWRVPYSLADAGDSWESRVATAVHALLKADEWFSDTFKPIRLVESPTARQLLSYAQGTLAVFPGVPSQPGFPSNRIKPEIAIFFAAYLPLENGSEDSKLNAAKVQGRLRKLLWNNQRLVDSETLTDHTIRFDWIEAVTAKDGGTLISVYRATYQTDLEPTTGDLI